MTGAVVGGDDDDDDDDDDRCDYVVGVASRTAKTRGESKRDDGQHAKKQAYAHETHTTQSAMQPGNQAAETAGSRLGARTKEENEVRSR